MSGVPPSADQVDGASSVLVLRPRSGTVDDTEIKRALVGRPEETALIGISLSERPTVWCEKWRDVLEDDLDAAAVITTRDLATDGSEDGVAVETVATPSNLTRIGVKATTFLSQWDDPTVIVECLSMLFQYASSRDIYQFLHVLTTRLRTNGGEVQVYLDPVVEDDRTIERLKSLFDVVIEYDRSGDGESDWMVRRRPL
jgi:hypothetical protein